MELLLYCTSILIIQFSIIPSRLPPFLLKDCMNKCNPCNERVRSPPRSVSRHFIVRVAAE